MSDNSVTDAASISRLLRLAAENDDAAESPSTATKTQEKFPQLSRYTLLERIGSGGMGTVYKATDRQTGHTVAVKVLYPALSIDSSFVGRFQREARVVLALDHPNLIPATDSGEENSQYYIAMEYIEGHPVEYLLQQQGRLPLEQGLRIIRQTAQALAYAHNRGLIHRDIKPGNILQNRNGEIRLADLGLAGYLESEESAVNLTTVGTVLGTPEYLSPEQALGNAPVDQRSDIYSLGATMFAILGGQSPIPCRNLYEAIRWHASGQAPDLCEINPEIPPHVAAVAAKAMQPPADLRYQTIDQFIIDLDCLQQGKPPQFAMQTESARSRQKEHKDAGRRSLLAAALVIAVILLIIGARYLSDQNKIQNGGFSDGFAGWAPSSTPALSIAAQQGIRSSAAALFDATFSGKVPALIQQLELENGQTYSLKLSARQVKRLSEKSPLAALLPDAGFHIRVFSGDSIWLDKQIYLHSDVNNSALWETIEADFTPRENPVTLEISLLLMSDKAPKELLGNSLSKIIRHFTRQTAPQLYIDNVTITPVKR